MSKNYVLVKLYQPSGVPTGDVEQTNLGYFTDVKRADELLKNAVTEFAEGYDETYEEMVEGARTGLDNGLPFVSVESAETYFWVEQLEVI